MWHHFHHVADIGVCGVGDSREQAFEEAAIAMTAVITDPAKVVCTETISIDCEADDDELLLVDWLNSLVFEMSTRKFLFSQFHVKFEGSHLHATACGEPIDIVRHQPAAEVKGATYSELAVTTDASGLWRAQCVVDV